MGHIRNQYAPQTIAWLRVVESLAEGGNIALVAEATAVAASKGLGLAKTDAGVTYTVWLLARIVKASRDDNFLQSLTTLGISLPDSPGATDLVAAYSECVDRHLSRQHNRTDLGEMAQLAGTEALASLVGAKSGTLFGESEASLKDAVRAFSTSDGFAKLAHSFFARVTERYLGYHLSRELSQHVGQNQRFADPDAHSEFLQRMRGHSREVASIVREFAGGWFSKSSYETGLSEESVQGFVSYALTKIRGEIQDRGTANVG